jgi:hypothetical protein
MRRESSIKMQMPFTQAGPVRAKSAFLFIFICNLQINAPCNFDGEQEEEM